MQTSVSNRDAKFDELVERLNQNLADYHSHLEGFGAQELIDMAGKISAMSDAHHYMTISNNFSDDELDFYLQFQNPLEVVADYWVGWQGDISDMSFNLDHIAENRHALLEAYPLVGDPVADTTLHRYMDVDLNLYLGVIAEKVIVHYPDDWNYDKETLLEALDSRYYEDKQLIWHVCSYDTHLKKESDVFIKNSDAFKYMTNYRQNASDIFGYVIEVTGHNGNAVAGNIFEVGDYANFAQYIRETALLPDSVTLTYSDDWGTNAGKTITVSCDEYNSDRQRLTCESGDVTSIRYHSSESIIEMAERIRQRREKRMALPTASPDMLLRKVTDKLAEVRNPMEQNAQNSTTKSQTQKRNTQMTNTKLDVRVYPIDEPEGSIPVAISTFGKRLAIQAIQRWQHYQMQCMQKSWCHRKTTSRKL